MRVSYLSILTVALVVGVLGARRADAYPQFQMSRDTTCTACHVSPSGGGLLTENGLVTAESMSTFGTAPEIMYGKLETPSWLTLGGDVRALSGYFASPQRYLLTIPMQTDVYARATYDQFSALVTVGYRPPEEGNEATTSLWAREHYLMWQGNPGGRSGLYIRAGHLMPVFGLRLVEHNAYTRRYGGTPLYAETYGASFSIVDERYEAHVSGFVKNPIQTGVVDANGAAAYGELTVAENTRIGAGGMMHQFDWQRVSRAALTAKHYIPAARLLLQAEAQFVYSTIQHEANASDDFGVRGVVGTLMASYAPTDAILVDLGLGHYDPNLRIFGLDRDAVDLNVHWFVTSHLEAMLVNRFELVGWGDTGAKSGWTMAQIHYRL